MNSESIEIKIKYGFKTVEVTVLIPSSTVISINNNAAKYWDKILFASKESCLAIYLYGEQNSFGCESDIDIAIKSLIRF